MSDESTTLVAPTLPEQKTEPQGRNGITISDDRLGSDFFGIERKEEPKKEQPPVTEVAKTTPVTETPKTEEPKTEIPPQTTAWIKEFGWDNEEAAKAEIKKLKESKPEEKKFENEQSQKVYQLLAEGKVDDVLDIYGKQKSIDKVIALEVNKDTAADIIKLNMQLKYPSLTKEQIDFQYRQEYGIPKEPVIKDTEDEPEFQERHNEWKQRVSDIEMKATIAATMAKPEIESAKTKIVLPDISQAPQLKPPTQEELDAAKKFDAEYIQSVDNSVKTFNGVTVTVKNEVVDFPVSYGVTDEDKKSLVSVMKEFQDSNYNANSLFAGLWVNEDKTLKTDQMIEDYYLLKNKKAMFSKIANDSANKAIEAYIKGKKNINVNETNVPGTAEFNKDNKTEADVIRDQFFG